VLENKLNLNIYDYTVLINSDEVSVIDNLKQDFSNFISKDSQKTMLVIDINKTSELATIIPRDLKASKQSQNSITYDVGPLRYNDFYGKGISLFNYKEERAQIYYTQINQLHEMIYLLILSRSGKYMDRNGLHKIHACAVNKNDMNLVLMMPSKGGKTTTFIELLKDNDMNIISDDTPVVNIRGELKSFSLRLGVENKNILRASFPYIAEKDIYNFERVHYSCKYLLATTKLRNKINVSQNTILIAGFRSTNTEPKIYSVSKISMYKELITHMVIGIGLPMIIEYFLENSIRDSIRNVKILVSRNLSAFRLLMKSECYFLETSSNIKSNTELIKKLLNER
jgi:hypothetical protein